MSTFCSYTLGFAVSVSAKLEMESQFVNNRPYPTIVHSK